MGAFHETVNNIIDNARRKNPKEEGDYTGKDGLLYCGKCHTPKESRVNLFGNGETVVPVPCKCRVEARKNEEEIAQKKKKAEQINRLKKRSLMDAKFSDCKFENLIIVPENKKQIAIAKRYAEKFDELYRKNQGLLFYGDVGTGKTQIACCIGNVLMDKLNPVFCTSFVKILQKANGFRNLEDKEIYLARMNQAKLLILDDLGAERGTDYALEIVYNIIDTRYRSGKPMVVTTNLSIRQMQEEESVKLKRIYDRIFEVCYPVEFKGKSWRLKEAAKRYDEISKLLEDD